MGEAAWWKGTRGEWYVVTQVVLNLLILLGPRRWHGWPDWPFPDGWVVALGGWALVVAGLCLATAGAMRLGKALTPLPYPAQKAVLRDTGAYRIVRHPMYAGVLLAAFGWALAWLVERFPGYEAYQRRVRKLIPFLY